MTIVTEQHDIDDGFRWYRAICIARNWPDIPTTFDDLMPGTQATIREAAAIRARERRADVPKPTDVSSRTRSTARTIAIPMKRDPHATMPKGTPVATLRERMAAQREEVA